MHVCMFYIYILLHIKCMIVYVLYFSHFLFNSISKGTNLKINPFRDKDGHFFIFSELFMIIRFILRISLY